MRKKLSLIMKYVIVSTSLLGVFIALWTTKLDGYSYWGSRFLYFTNLSNLWIGFTVLAILLLPLFKKANQEKWKEKLYLLKYVFTVSITVTGLVFCCLLAPFADESYRPWSWRSIGVHVLSPLASILDFFLEEQAFPWKKRQVFYPIIPPLCYFAFALILGACGVDFGRGETFPYFFLNFKGEAGFFGFVDGDLPQFGSMYWIILILLLILSLSMIYALKYKKKKPI